MAYAELEIRIHYLYGAPPDAGDAARPLEGATPRSQEGASAARASGSERYRIDARFSHSESDVDYAPSVETDVALASLGDPLADGAAYGHQLWRVLFGEVRHHELLRIAVARAGSLRIPLRIRLHLDHKDTRLHQVHWELLRDPDGTGPLAADERYRFSRYIGSDDTRDVRLRPRGALRALVVVADPSDLERYRLAPIDVEAEVGRAEASLQGLTVHTLATRGEATLEHLLDRLRDRQGFDILYLVCHGRIVDGEPWLWLERSTGETHRVSGDELAVRLGRLIRPPSLVVLASCQSGGAGPGRIDGGALVGVGPKLTAQGVPTVLGMQGDITVETVERFVPTLFRVLVESGQIDHAVTVARAAVADRPDWWIPVLFTRLKGGRLWYTPGFTSGNDDEEMWDTLLDRIARGSCTPVLGPGVTDGILGSRREIAVRLAQTHHYPMALHQHESLPQVTQFLEVNRRNAYLRDQFVDQLGHEVCERYGRRVPGLDARCPDGRPRFTPKELDTLISDVGRWQRKELEHEPHRVLASLDLDLYITANVSNLLADALVEAGKDPLVDRCRWNEQYVPLTAPEEVADGATPRPLVYHLYGRVDEPRDVVLTEDDFFTYLISVASNRRMVPKVVSEALMDSSLLFLGFNLDDWTFRVLYQLILSQEGSAMLKEHRHVAVQIDPDEGRTPYPDRARQYFERYFRRNEISLYWGSAHDFVEELARRRGNRP